MTKHRSDLHHLTIAEGSKLCAKRVLSPVEWTRALLDRIAMLDPWLHAYLRVTEDVAMRHARVAESELGSGRSRGPLHGVPFALKDLFDTADIPTTAHSRVAIDRVPRHDATAVARLHAAGAVLLGKLSLHEFAHGGPSLDNPWPPARNPWNPMHFPGSSSSGSGVAIAAGMSPGALGTDTGGSIRIPAGLCGIAGLKPTYGRVSRHGVIPCAPSLDQCGPMAWTTADCALLLQCIAGRDPLDPTTSDEAVPCYAASLNGELRGLRIGVVRHFWESDLSCDAQAGAAIESALLVLKELGATLEPVELEPLQRYNDARVIIQEPEVFAVHHADLVQRPEAYGRDFLGRVLFACVLGANVYVEAQRCRAEMVAQMRGVLRDVDALVTLGPGPAPRYDAERTLGFVHALWARSNLTSPFSVTGFPALSVCTGFTSAGLPLSMQVAGRPFDEATVLRIGDAYERATSWRERRPVIVDGATWPPIVLAADEPSPAVDARTRTMIERCVEQAGLSLDDGQMALMLEAAPHALAMARRIRIETPWAVEPATAFRL